MHRALLPESFFRRRPGAIAGGAAANAAGGRRSIELPVCRMCAILPSAPYNSPYPSKLNARGEGFLRLNRHAVKSARTAVWEWSSAQCRKIGQTPQISENTLYYIDYFLRTWDSFDRLTRLLIFCGLSQRKDKLFYEQNGYRIYPGFPPAGQ